MALFYEFNKLTNEQISKICQALLGGKIIILPTETVYGLCCLATNANAVNKIYKIKKRSFDKPLTILISEISEINNFAILKNEAISDLKAGTTVILQTKPNNFCKSIYGNQDGTGIGIRMPNNYDILVFLSKIGQNIVATSVNLSGEPALIKIEQISKQILSNVDIVIFGDEICGGIPSSIIDYRFLNSIKLR